MDDIAHALGIDPLEIRLLNAFDEGSISPTGQMLHSVVVRTSLQKAANASAGRRGGDMKRRGRGIACMWYPIGFTVSANPSAAIGEDERGWHRDAADRTVETGQGALTVLAQIAAEELGIATDDVHVVSADTDTTPMDTGRHRQPHDLCHRQRGAPRGRTARRSSCLSSRRRCSVFKPSQLEARDRRIHVEGLPAARRARSARSPSTRNSCGASRRSAAPHGTRRRLPCDPDTGQGKPFGPTSMRRRSPKSTWTTRPAKSK